MTSAVTLPEQSQRRVGCARCLKFQADHFLEVDWPQHAVDAVADLLVALVQIRPNNDRVASVGVIVLEDDDPAPFGLAARTAQSALSMMG
jgi:hypothetical protein